MHSAVRRNFDHYLIESTCRTATIRSRLENNGSIQWWNEQRNTRFIVDILSILILFECEGRKRSCFKLKIAGRISLTSFVSLFSTIELIFQAFVEKICRSRRDEIEWRMLCLVDKSSYRPLTSDSILDQAHLNATSISFNFNWRKIRSW